MVALKHKARLLLHWHHICFGLAYMAGTSQHYNAGFTLWAWQSAVWTESLFMLCWTMCQAGRLFFTIVPLVPLPLHCFFLSAHHVSRSLGSQTWFLGSSFLHWSWPRNASYSFIIIIILSPPAYCIRTLISAIFTHAARLLIKARAMLSENGNAAWKKSWKFKGSSSNWCIIKSP